MKNTVDLGKHGKFQIHPGKLHEALGLNPDTPISDKRLEQALHSKDPEIRKMAASAKGLRAMRH